MNINDCRPVVQRFAILMETVLRKNDDKGGWNLDGFPSLMDRLGEEVEELWEAIETPGGETRMALIAKEAADVANFAMMVADNTGKL